MNKCCYNCEHWSQDDHPDVAGGGDMRILRVIHGTDNPGPWQDQLGRCLRYPPTINPVLLRVRFNETSARPPQEDSEVAAELALDPYVYSWPVTTGDSRCGEFKPSETARIHDQL